MNPRPLEGCLIAIAGGSAHALAPDAPGARATALEARTEAILRAGAETRSASLTEDLWSLLSETSFDLIVVVPERDDPAGVAVYDQLRGDPRTAAIPMVIVSNTDVDATRYGSITLAPALSDAAFVRALCELALPRKKLREAEQQERILREQLRVELVRAEQEQKDRADLAHELRAMLGAAFGFACNLRDEIPGPLAADQRTHVAGILDAVERAAKLLEKSSGGAGASPRPISLVPASGPPRAQRTLVHLARIATEVVTLFEVLAVRKGLRLRYDCDDTVAVWGDALKLKQVLTNLVMNGIKYTPAGGEILVKVGWTAPSGAAGVQARRSAEILVSDSGPGIAPEYRERIFSRGFRMPLHRELPGQGIGLSVVKEIVVQHGGSVGVEGEAGEGASFRVILPQDRRQRARDEGVAP